MTTRKLRQRELILGGDPDARFSVPVEADFDRQGKDWIEAQGCAKIAEKLIMERPCLDPLKAAQIRYLWKRKGSTSPKLVLGKCQRPSGLGFADEIKYYGFWKRDVQAIADVVEKTLQLPFDYPTQPPSSQTP